MDTCQWMGCSVAPVLPCRVPDMLRKYGSVLEMTSEMESLPKHAVKNGVWMDAKSLIQFAVANKVPEPKGSGAVNPKGKANVLKADWAAAVVLHFCPDADESTRSNLVQMMLGQKKKIVADCPATLIDSVESLDPDNANMQMFRQIKRIAEDQQREAKEARGPPELSPDRPLMPKDLHVKPSQSRKPHLSRCTCNPPRG